MHLRDTAFQSQLISSTVPPRASSKLRRSAFVMPLQFFGLLQVPPSPFLNPNYATACNLDDQWDVALDLSEYYIKDVYVYVCVCIMYMFVLVARDDLFTLNYSAQLLWIIANVGNKLKSVSCIYLVIRAYYLIGTWI